MLSDGEHETLSEIEQRLELEGPGTSKEASAAPEPPLGGRWERVFDSVICVAALRSAVAVLVGAYGQALGYASIAGGRGVDLLQVRTDQAGRSHARAPTTSRDAAPGTTAEPHPSPPQRGQPLLAKEQR
jgi:hypothetical protein